MSANAISPGVSRAFEAGVLKAFLTQPRVLRTFRRTLQAYHFTHTPIREVARVAFEAVTDIGEAPTRGELDYLLRKEADKAQVSLDTAAAIQKAADEVWETELTSVTRDHMTSFISRAEMAQVAQEFAEVKPGGEDDHLRRTIARLQSLTSDVTSDALTMGRNFFGDGPDGLERTVEDAGRLYDSSYVLQTGWTLFDRVMMGGFRPKEGNVVLGPTNAGKSELMIALGRVFNSFDKRVVLYGIDSTLEEMSERVVVSQSGVEIDMRVPIPDRKEAMLRKAPRHDLFVYREWSPGRHRISDIRTHLQVVADTLGPIDEAKGRPNPGGVDAILVDSPYLMVAENRSREAHRFDLASIYYEWIALLKDLDIVGIATHQATREAMEKMSLSLAHVAEALAIVQPCANVFGLPSRTMAERANRTRRLQMLKLRKPEGVGREVRFVVNERRQMFYEDPDQDDLGYMWRKGGTDAPSAPPPVSSLSPRSETPADLSALASLGQEARRPPGRRGVGPSTG